MSTSEHIRYNVENGIGIITIDRPAKRNALTFDMIEALRQRIHQAESDDQVVACLLCGTGGLFTAGMDYSEAYEVYQRAEGQDQRRPAQRTRLRVDEQIAQVLDTVTNCTKPVIVRAEKYCLGFGAFLVLAADLCIATEDTQIGFPEEKIGFSGAMPMLNTLILSVGLKRARRLLLLGKVISGTEAEDIGLIAEAVPAEELDQAVESMLTSLRHMPKDGLAIGRMATRLALQELGAATRQTLNWTVLHTLFTNLRYEDGEFNMIRKRERGGVGEVVRNVRQKRDDN